MSVMSFLPSEREDLDTLRKRQARMIGAVAHATSFEGIMLRRDDPEVQLVLKALAEGIKKRLADGKAQKEEPVRRMRPERRKTGKTERDREKENFVPYDVKKRAKSEASQLVRRQAQGAKGKK